MTGDAGVPRRDVYLSSIPLEEAEGLWREACHRLELPRRLPAETVPTEDALGRVASGPVFATASSPHYHAAAMDGIAVRAADTAGAAPTTPKRLRVGVEATHVNTGEPLPEHTDAVIMIEDVAAVDTGLLEITAAASPWQHTRVIGEDVVATDIVVPARQWLRPSDLGALLAASVTEVEVLRRPRVAIIPTGGEIVIPGEAREPGQIPDFNSPMLSARLAEVGAEAHRQPVAPDTRQAIRDAIEAACAEFDIVLTIAGASAGSRDFTAEAIGTAGELLVHGVAIRPGKPVALGVVANTPVIALPGYPVSAMLCCELFVVPTICRLLGISAPQRPRVRAALSRKVASHAGSREYLRVHMGEVAGWLVAVPMARGAGLITTLSRADGLVVMPSLSEGCLKGEEVDCELLRPEHEVRNTLLITGSHDVALDLLASEIRTADPELSVASTHVGSMAGLAALRDGFCHLAGTHLLDPESGKYNWAYLRRLFGEELPLLVTVAHRQQGFMVAPGNPLAIRSWEDLIRPEVRFINRQPGAGTRVLLDYELTRREIPPERVEGYRHEMFTHLAVASIVETGAADVGLGILAAARARGLDFVPLTEERYDLAVRADVWESAFGEALRGALASDSFRAELERLGGYRASDTGLVQAPPAH